MVVPCSLSKNGLHGGPLHNDRFPSTNIRNVCFFFKLNPSIVLFLNPAEPIAGKQRQCFPLNYASWKEGD